MAARNEWPVNVWKSSQKSPNSSFNFLLSMAFVKFFDDLRAKTGFSGSKITSLIAKSLSLVRAADGHELEPGTG